MFTSPDHHRRTSLRTYVAAVTLALAIPACGSDDPSACDRLADLAERVQDGEQSATSNETIDDLQAIAERAVQEGDDAAQAAQGVLIDIDTYREDGDEDRLAGTLSNMIDACGL